MPSSGDIGDTLLCGLHFTLPIILSLSLRSEEIKSTILKGNQILTEINLIEEVKDP